MYELQPFTSFLCIIIIIISWALSLSIIASQQWNAALWNLFYLVVVAVVGVVDSVNRWALWACIIRLVTIARAIMRVHASAQWAISVKTEHDGADDDADQNPNRRDDVRCTSKCASMLRIGHHRLSGRHCKRSTTQHNSRSLAASVAINWWIVKFNHLQWFQWTMTVRFFCYK